MTYPQQYQHPVQPQQYAQMPVPPQQIPQPQYAQQPYAQAAPPEPAIPLAQGSLDDFYAQPSTGGGPSLPFENIGDEYVLAVHRPVTSADIEQQTEMGTNRPAFYKDGRPKFVMKVPVQLLVPNPKVPDGMGTLYVRGQLRDEISRAMAEAGAPAGPPEHGCGLRVRLVGVRPIKNMSPQKLYQVTYSRPVGAPPVEQQPLAPAPAPVAEQPLPAPVAAPAASPVQQPVAPAPAAPAPVAAPAPAAQPVAAQPLPAPPGLDPAQAALLAQMTGQAAPPAA